MTTLPERIAALSPDRRLLLLRRLRARSKPVPAPAEASPPAAQIVAYYAGACDEGALGEYLAARLPDYMLPAALIRLERLPRTAGGKVDRRALPDAGGSADRASDRPEAPRDAREAALAEIWSEVLGMSVVGVHDDFFELGGDSILSIRIIAKANQAGIHVAPEHFFDSPTVAGMAAAASVAPVSNADAEQGATSGEVPLSPIQHWFFEHHAATPQHWNQAMLLETDGDPSAAALDAALKALLDHHDALRLRFSRDERGWRQHLAPPGDVPPIADIVLDGKAPAAQAREIDLSATRLHESLSLESGPLLRVAIFRYGPGEGTKILVVAHHLVVDAFSWPILLEDFVAACDQHEQGVRLTLPAKTTSFKQFSERLAGLARAGALADERDTWSAMQPVAPPAPDTGDTNPENRVDGADTVVRTLANADTGAFRHDAAQALRAKPEEILVTALACSIAAWTGEHRVALGLERHGRDALFEDLDLSRTVGWFTSFFPVTLEVRDHGNPVACLAAVKDCLRALPRQGGGFGVLRYLDADAAARARLDPASRPWLAFNYLGAYDPDSAALRGFRVVSGTAGQERNPRGERAFLLELNALVAGGRLEMRWTYASRAYRRETIEGVADRFVAAIHALIANARSDAGGALAPSDFPLAGLDRDALDRIAGLLDDVDDERGG